MTNADRLLARILEHPNLVPAVRQASPETFCAVVAEVGRLAPELPRTWLIGELPNEEVGRRAIIREALAAGCAGIGLAKSAVDSRIVRLAHLAGLAVFSWTVNDRPTARRLRDLGVDAIITDAPDVVFDELGR